MRCYNRLDVNSTNTVDESFIEDTMAKKSAGKAKKSLPLEYLPLTMTGTQPERYPEVVGLTHDFVENYDTAYAIVADLYEDAGLLWHAEASRLQHKLLRDFKYDGRKEDETRLLELHKKFGVQPPAAEVQFTYKDVLFEFIYVPPGLYLLGSEAQQYPTEVTEPIYMLKTQVTQQQWSAVMDNNPSHFKQDIRNPVESISWEECQTFCQRLTELLSGFDDGGWEVGLPWESQWEYAIRAGISLSPFSFGDDEKELGEYAWFNDNSQSRTHPVKQKKPNLFGFYDMHGNVWEWCEDWYSADFFTNAWAEVVRKHEEEEREKAARRSIDVAMAT